MKPTLSKLVRRLERRKKLHAPKYQPCPRCGAASGRGGVLVLQREVLEGLPRDAEGRPLEALVCPECQVPPIVALPDNQR
jgi:uncharacterized protein with PIN domain